MDVDVYLHNFYEALTKYNDTTTAREWLERARKECLLYEYRWIIEAIFDWAEQELLSQPMGEQVLQLLAEIDPAFAARRRREIERRERDGFRLERERRAAENEGGWRRLAERLEEQRRTMERIEKEWREKQQRRAEEERLAREQEKRKQAEEEERRRREREAKERRRNSLLKEIDRFLREDFLGVEPFFRSKVAQELVSEAEFADRRRAFIRDWFSRRSSGRGTAPTSLPDDEQLEAIAAVNGDVQVVARAGSGKTATLVNRVLFLIEHCRVAAEEILVLAFNRAAAAEIRRRLLVLRHPGADPAIRAEVAGAEARWQGGGKRPTRLKLEEDAVASVAERLQVALPHVMTFHALAYAIVRPRESLLYDDRKADTQTLSRTVQRIIDQRLQIPDFYHRVRTLMLRRFKTDWEQILKGGHHLSRDEFLRYRRSLPHRALKGHDVKSHGEKVIANFLFEHDVPYLYEYAHLWRGRPYRPDFTVLKGKNTGTVIEYFGMLGHRAYDEETHEKRRYWQSRAGWTLIEVGSPDLQQGEERIRLHLEDRLTELGIRLKRLSEDEIWERIRDREIGRFTELCKTFVGRCRKLCLSPRELRDRVARHEVCGPDEDDFLDIVSEIYDAYLEYLHDAGDEDFDGLLQRAAAEIDRGRTSFERKFGSGDVRRLRHICIDEFQDFSELLYRMIRSIRSQNPSVQLFCVGDDWQAINGFAGSDLRFFEEFEKYVGERRLLYLSTNYRSAKAIVEIGNAMMKGRGEPARAQRSSRGEVVVADIRAFEPKALEQEQYRGDRLTPALLRIIGKALSEKHSIALYSRTNTIPWPVALGTEKREAVQVSLEAYHKWVTDRVPRSLRGKIGLHTAHAFKGREQHTVIIVDAIERRYPLLHPDWVFFRVLGESVGRIIEEERRLFYVALTRAVERLVIVADDAERSPFLAELKANISLVRIDWGEYPPFVGESARVIVRVGNLPGHGSSAVRAIKDLLRASGYEYSNTEWPCWFKSYAREQATVEHLGSEDWAAHADAVEVRVCDERDETIARYLVDKRNWIEMKDGGESARREQPGRRGNPP